MAARRIEHVVVLMLENRSFDHLFGFRSGVKGLSGDEFNLPDPAHAQSTSNAPVRVAKGAPFAVLAGLGPSHSLNAASIQLCNNRNGPSAAVPARNIGFVKSYHDALVHDGTPHPTKEQIAVVMQSFSPEELPSLNALADEFCVCDQWFSEVPGPTHPNRLYIHAGTSAGFAHNVFPHTFDFRTIYNSLEDAGCTWATYDFDDNEVRHFSRVNGKVENFKKFAASFAVDVSGSRLPNYSFILPRFLNTASQLANSQHAPEDARHGDNLVADVYAALRANPNVWSKSALIVTYDENGGFYDHVIPPADGIPNPDGLNSPPPGDASFAPPFAFNRLGFRVPAVVASPWVKKGTVDSTRYQHTSVLATLKKLFGLSDFLTARDAAAHSFEQMFMSVDTPRTDTPTRLPRATPPAVTVSADDPTNPANLPLDETQQNMLLGAIQLTQGAHPLGVSAAVLPTRQGQASEYIQACYDNYVKRGTPRNEFRIAREGTGFRWQLRAADGTTLAASPQTYADLPAATKAVARFQQFAPGASLVVGS